MEKFMMTDGRVNLIIVDDHAGVRKGIGVLLQAAEDIEIVGEAANGKQAIELAATKKPDIIILDVELPDMRGDAVMQHIRAELPDIKVLAISAYSDQQYVLGMRNGGASGYLTKEMLPSRLLASIRRIVYEGAGWIGPHITRDSPAFDTTLTLKEAEILKHLLLEQSEHNIALSLNMKAKQVGEHLKFLMRKYQVDSLAALREIAKKIFS